MHATIHRPFLLPLASVIMSIAGSETLTAQLISGRPASVALTVVVPPRDQDRRAILAREGSFSLLGGTSTELDLETFVGLGNRVVSRIEVRLGEPWATDSTRVLVRNYRGQFERLMQHGSVVALDEAQAASSGPSRLRVRVQSDAPLVMSSLAIPLEYRLTVGRGDEFSVWSFPSLLRVDTDH